MRIKSIHLENFRVHADTYIELPDEGVVGIIGSNESGKSTILEGVAWALFGGKAIRGTKAGLLWHGAAPGAECRVTVSFTTGGEQYVVERTEDDAKLRDAAGRIVTQGTRPVNEKVPELLGLTHDEFTSSHFVLQKDVSRIASMLPTERQAFIRQVMGVGRIDDALKACRKGKASLAEELRGMDAMVGSRQPLVDAVENAEAAKAQLVADIEAAKQEAKAAKEAYATIEERLEESAKQREEWREVSAALERVQGQIQTERARLEREPKLESELNDPDGIREEIEFLQGEIAKREDEHESFSLSAWAEAKQARDEAKIAFQDHLDERQATKDRLRTLIEANRANQRPIRKRLERLEELGGAGTCPTCTQPLEDHYEEAVQSVKAELQERVAEESELTDKLEGFETEKDPTSKELAEAYNEAERTFATLDDRKTEIEREQEEMYRWSGDIERLEARADRIKAELDGLDAVHKKLDILERKAAATEAKLEAIEFAPEEHERLERDQKQAASEVSATTVAASRLGGKLEGADAAIESAKSALADHDKRVDRIEKVREEHQLHEKADSRISAFRVAIASTIRPQMEELVSGFVSILTDGRHESVEIAEDFSVTMYESGEPVEVVSGGTDDIGALAMRLAISQMIAERAGKPIELLVMDEPFGSLDEVRRAAVLNLVKALRKTFPQVITMSHVAETREMVDMGIQLHFDESERHTTIATEAA